MGNRLNEITDPVNESGRETRVIDKPIPVEIGFWSVLFEIFVWGIGFILVAFLFFSLREHMELWAKIMVWILAFVPGIVYTIAKINARKYFMQLEQKIQACASEIGQYQEQRYQILKNVASLVEKAVTLDKEVMTAVAAYRGGVDIAKGGEILDHGFASLVPHLEAYPDLKAHSQIAEALRQNNHLQKEITAARDLYNRNVLIWNKDIFEWPIKMIVAAREHYTTRIPFSISKESLEGSKIDFFA